MTNLKRNVLLTLAFLLACLPLFSQVNTAPMPLPVPQFFSATGQPLAGGKLYTYSAGTTSPLATYTDGTGLIQNSNPIVLNAAGFPVNASGNIVGIWLAPVKYKIILQNSSSVQQWLIDQVGGNNLFSLSNLNIAESTAPSCNIGSDILWGDSAGHRYKMCNNNSVPDFIVGQNSVDTLANKTLVSPVLITPSFSGAAVMSQLNSTVYADQYLGTTADAKITNAQSNLAGGQGIIDATGFPCGPVTIASQVHLNDGVILKKKPCTTFFVTQADGGVVFLMGKGAHLVGFGVDANQFAPYFADIYNSSTSNISYDFAPTVPGSNETYSVEKITVASDPVAIISGGLFQINGVFVNTVLRDIYTFNCYAPSALVVTAPAGGVIKGTSDIAFDNDNFDCTGQSTGPVVSISAPATTGLGNLGFHNGGIQHAGTGQSLLVINGNAQGPSTGTGATGFYFYGTQFETIAPGGNACAIQLIDAQQVSINSFSLTGPAPAGTSNAVCITETASGRSHDISVDHISTASAWTNLFTATPFGLSAILTGTGAKEYLGYRYNGTTTFINSALGFGGNPIHFYQTTTDTPGAITVNANTCTDRGVTITGLLTSAVIIPTANYAIEAGIAPEAGQAVAGTAHYRICNHTTGNVTLNAAATFNLAILQ